MHQRHLSFSLASDLISGCNHLNRLLLSLLLFLASCEKSREDTLQSFQEDSLIGVWVPFVSNPCWDAVVEYMNDGTMLVRVRHCNDLRQPMLYDYFKATWGLNGETLTREVYESSEGFLTEYSIPARLERKVHSLSKNLLVVSDQNGERRTYIRPRR